MLTAIRQWVTKTMLKSKGQTGVVQTLPKKELIEINTQITAQRLLQNGIDPNSLKNSDQVENAIIAIESRPAVQEGIRSTPEAKVFDMEGKEIPKGSKIMGGKEVEADLPPPGSRGGPDDIAAPFASQEETMTNIVKDELMKTDNPFSDLVKTTEKGPKSLREREAEVLAGMEKNNKEAVQRIKNRKMVKDAVDNASPGFVKGDRKYNAQMVAEDLADKRFGKEFYDLDQRQQMDIYDEALEGYDEITRGMPDPEDFAQGGRAGFKGGMGKGFLEFIKKFGVKQSGDDLKDFLSKRKFLKDMVGNTQKNKRARESYMLQEAMKDAKGFEFPSGKELRTDIEKTIGPILLKDRKLNSDGGRAGFKAGLGKRFLELLKGKPKPKFDVERFREGPIDLKFLENIDKKDLAPFIRTRDTMGPGGYGMYDDFADMPAGLRAAELISTIKGPANKINYRAAELFLGKKLRGDETVDELLQVLNRQEMRADGGRIGLKAGMTKRAFLKLMGGVGATIGAAKSGILGLGEGTGKKAVTETVKQAAGSGRPPPYFFKLVEKIKFMGDDVTEKAATQERQIVKRYKDYEMSEDIGTGEIIIKKRNEGSFYDQDGIISDEYIVYKPGQADELTKGKKPPPEYEEFTVRPDGEGKLRDTEGGLDSIDEILEEVGDPDSMTIKKAGGGIARMLGE